MQICLEMGKTTNKRTLGFNMADDVMLIILDFFFYLFVGGGLIVLPVFAFVMRDKLAWFPGKNKYTIKVYNFKKDMTQERIDELEENPDLLDIDDDLILAHEKEVWRMKIKGVFWLWFETFFIFGVPLDYHLSAFLIDDLGKPTIRVLQIVPKIWQEKNLKPIDIPRENPDKLTWKNYTGQISAANREAIDATNEEIAKDKSPNLLFELGIPAMAIIFSLLLILFTTSYGDNLNKATMGAIARAPQVFCTGYAQEQLVAAEAARLEANKPPDIFNPGGTPLNVTK